MAWYNSENPGVQKVLRFPRFGWGAFDGLLALADFNSAMKTCT